MTDQTASTTLGVIGLGYVGLPLAVEAGQAGINVIGFDVNETVADLVNAGASHIQDVPAEHVATLRDAA
ncbi:MAG: NAD(P)-binding domain-containing protein, partial [Longimicrobiales bacterium]